MKRLFLLIMVMASVSASAQIKFGVRGGINAGDGSDPFVGAQAEVSLPLLPITFVPNTEYYFVKNATSANVNLDVQYTIISVGIAKIMAGGGYSFGYIKPDKISGFKAPDAQTDSGFNIQAGAKASLGLNVFGLLRMTKIGSGDFVKSLVIGTSF